MAFSRPVTISITNRVVVHPTVGGGSFVEKPLSPEWLLQHPPTKLLCRFALSLFIETYVDPSACFHATNVFHLRREGTLGQEGGYLGTKEGCPGTKEGYPGTKEASLGSNKRSTYLYTYLP